MATYSDNFNRASLGANWSAINGTWAINASTDAICTVDSGWNQLEYVGGVADTVDQYSQCVVVLNTNYCGPALRCVVGVNSLYAGVSKPTSTHTIRKIVSGTPTTLATGGSSSAGDTHKLTAEDLDGGTTTRLKLFVNDVEQSSVDDTTAALQTPKSLGLHTPHLNMRMDDWEAGDLSAPAAAVIRRNLMLLGVGR